MEFCNMSLPLATRVDDLLSRLTLEEKLSLMGLVTINVHNLQP